MLLNNRDYLLDTCVFIHFWRKHDVAKEIITDALRSQATVGYSVLTISELWAGIKDTAMEKDTKNMLQSFDCYPFTDTIARKAGQLKAKYGIPLMDAIIAATAAQNNLILVSNNTKHIAPLAQNGVIRFKEYSL